MANVHVTDEITAGRGTQSSQHRYVITLFGLYAQERGKSIPISGLVRLLAELDIDSSTARSSVSRLKRNGVLTQTAKGRYALSSAAFDHLSKRDSRIYDPQHAPNEGEWLIIVYTVPEESRRSRHLLRSGLQKMGFGTVNPGVWIGPAHLRSEAVDHFETHDLEQYVEFFTSSYDGPGAIAEKVSLWWDIDEIEARYIRFDEAFRPLLEEWRARAENLTACELEAEAFRRYVPMFNEWRSLPFLDPGLPRSTLPKSWAGDSALRLFGDLNAALSEGARAHAHRVLAQHDRRD